MTVDQQVRVTFQPYGRSVFVLPGTMVLEAAARAGLTIDTPCGGKGTCGKCRIQVTQGACPARAEDAGIFSAEEIQAGWRLACQTQICQECVIHVPESSLFASQHQILTEVQTEGQADVRPAVRKQYVELAEPTLADDASDLQRLANAIGDVHVELPLLRELPRLLRDGQFKGTAVLADHELIDLEPGDTASRCLGVAVDIGTTTVVASLLDLCTGEERAITSRMNPQVSYGDDVLSRISHASDSAKHLDEMRDVIVQALSQMIEELCREARVARQSIYEVAIAGNTTMEHLLLGIDVAQLGQVPFVPVFSNGLMIPAHSLGLPLAPRARAYVFGVIGGFVGGDTVAGVLATRLAELPGPTLMIDIGTNGEIVLASEGKLWAASTAAGPAFEGARISCGMRATRGAIEKVACDGEDLHISTIGNAEPVGLCGSGLIDLTAELLRTGLLSPEGRLLPAEDVPDSVPQRLRRRIVSGEDGDPLVLLSESAGAGRESRVTINQRDLRELQLATGAIRAGVKILLDQAGLAATDLASVLIAGGFGSFIRRSNAQRIGLLPTHISRERIHYVGNASLNGARWALVSMPARQRSEAVCRQAEHVELSQDMNFQMEFAEAMIFPTDEGA